MPSAARAWEEAK
ncbi:hypothetical protein VTH06DRAFT_7843 [Thermothelomyces fergusii]